MPYQASSATYTFPGVTLGTYTLTLPYIYLVTYLEVPTYLVWNPTGFTFYDKKVEFPGGTYQTVSIRKLETPDPLMDHTWEITVHCELDNEEMTAVEGAYGKGVSHKLWGDIVDFVWFLFAGRTAAP